MPNWRDYILQHFREPIHRLTLVADPATGSEGGSVRRDDDDGTTLGWTPGHARGVSRHLPASRRGAGSGHELEGLRTGSCRCEVADAGVTRFVVVEVVADVVRLWIRLLLLRCNRIARKFDARRALRVGFVRLADGFSKLELEIVRAAGVVPWISLDRRDA